MLHSGPDFPSYTHPDRVAYGIIHLLGLAAASIAIAWLLACVGPAKTSSWTAAIVVYGFGLLGMLSASALYNITRPGRLKAILRRLDHSMIFVMIAGSYTPFAITALHPNLGFPLCAVIWAMAGVGVGLNVASARLHRRLSLALCLAMGWLVLIVFRPLLAVVPGSVLLLLLVGGIIYSLGSLVHARGRMPFHNAVWHGMVMIAAGLHLTAVAQLSLMAPS